MSMLVPKTVNAMSTCFAHEAIWCGKLSTGPFRDLHTTPGWVVQPTGVTVFCPHPEISACALYCLSIGRHAINKPPCSSGLVSMQLALT